jgi:hypothetical protein
MMTAMARWQEIEEAAPELAARILHSGTADPPEWDPDAKISGVAEEVEPNRFRADVHEAVLIGRNDERNRLVIEVWTAAGDVRRVER